MLKHIPNTLTVIRFLLIPFIVLLVFQSNFAGAILLLVASGVTDILDGIIARHFNLISNFGKLMDPLADKLTQIAMLFALCITGILPLWLLLIFLLTQLLMIIGAGFLYRKDIIVHSKWYGKLGTVLLHFAILCSLFIKYWNSYLVPKHSFELLTNFDEYIYYAAIACSVFSFIMYLRYFFIKEYWNHKGDK